MARFVLPSLALAGSLALLSGCSVYQKPERPAWRTAAENACFAQNRVQLSSYVQIGREIDGPSICGLTRPLKVSALQNGAVRFNSTATLSCPMVADLEVWLAEVVQPHAQRYFGQEVVQIDSMGSYSCRGMNNQIGARLSEHSFGNGIDLAGFILADGRKISVRQDWTRGDEPTRAFLRAVQGGACEIFTTVLAPGSNAFHYDHIHVDLAQHGASSRGLRRICKPAPVNAAPPPPRRDNLPDAPEVEEETDIAQAKTAPGGSNAAAHAAPAFATPPAVAYSSQERAAETASQLTAAPSPVPRPDDIDDDATATTRDMTTAPIKRYSARMKGGGRFSDKRTENRAVSKPDFRVSKRPE